MGIAIQNPQKGRLEAIDIEFTDKNTTQFYGYENNDDVYKVTNFEGCVLISEFGYTYPICDVLNV